MVADFQPISSQSATLQDHMTEAAGTLCSDLGPTTVDTPSPLLNHCLAHSLAFSCCHRSCIGLEVQIRLAGTVLADDLIEATIPRDLQKVGYKLYSTAESTIPLANHPFLPVLSGPVISSNVEGTGGEVVSHLEHSLLGFAALHSNFPKREGALPCRGAWDLGSSRARVKVWGPRFPRSGSRHRRRQDDQPRHVDHDPATLVCASVSTSPRGSRAGRQGRSREGGIACHQY